jgi:hypothetical protein
MAKVKPPPIPVPKGLVAKPFAVRPPHWPGPAAIQGKYAAPPGQRPPPHSPPPHTPAPSRAVAQPYRAPTPLPKPALTRLAPPPLRHSAPGKGTVQRMLQSNPDDMIFEFSDASDFPRPNFKSAVKTNAVRTMHVFTDFEITNKTNLTLINGAVPHRMSFENLRANVIRYVNNLDEDDALLRWTDRLIQAGASETVGLRKALTTHSQYTTQINALIKTIKTQTKTLEKFRDNLMEKKADFYSGTTDEEAVIDAAAAFLDVLNSYHPNVKDIGAHNGVNLQVSKYVHLNIENSALSPTSEQILGMSPGRISQIATTPTGKHVVTVRGTNFPEISTLPIHVQNAIARHGTHKVNARETDMEV